MISMFLLLYVLSEPFELITQRWSGIASLSSVVWLKNSNLEQDMYIEMQFCYTLSMAISLKNGSYTPVLFTLLSMISEHETYKLMTYYIGYLYTSYQLFKMSDGDFLYNI